MIPGRVVAISRNGESHLILQGNRNLEEVMSPETSFDAASITKIMSTTAILMHLRESKLITLDDKVAHYLPLWAGNDKSSITIRNLLEHRSGLNEWVPLYLRYQDSESAHDFIARSPLKYPVGQSRHYSDLGFITLGKIIEVVTEKRLDAVFSEIIAAPLKLTSTQYMKPVNPENVAITSLGDRFERQMVLTQNPYPIELDIPADIQWREHWLNGEVNDGNAFKTLGGVSGHAGLFTSVSDMVKFGESLLSPGSFFSEEVVTEFLTPSSDPMQLSGFRTWKDGEYFGHTGFTGMALAINSHRNQVVAMCSNRLVVDGVPTPTDELLEEYLVDEQA
jgi:CubicO group peptidase (beta-lactamase class C family)